MLLIRKKTLGTASSDYFAQFQHLEHKRMACIHWYVTVQIEPFLAGGAVFDIHTARELCVESSGKHLVLFVGGCVHWAQTHICCIQCPSRIVHRHRHHCRPTDPSASRNQLTHRQELWRRKNTENRRTPRPRYFAHSDGILSPIFCFPHFRHALSRPLGTMQISKGFTMNTSKTCPLQCYGSVNIQTVPFC
ncbi:hypothetical protein Y032_0472g2070 [Ancylostoma ceylanicum]|uniref:Uncharacterized protein n=1 Tax=Ancylostoma ceylanicum TaxID=53326 RepID=A0A016WWS6_9BILA|nr:hypothetical protein Y032_0472g2070 [Ancylostoma ceylanicum]